MPDENSTAERAIYKLLSDRPDDVAEIAIAARDAVRKAAKECSEAVYETYCVADVFTFTGKLGQAFIHIATYANHVNLGFNRGAELADPDGKLKGSGKIIRHVRLNTKSELRSKPIKALIAAAVGQGREMAEAKGGLQPATIIINPPSKKKGRKH